MKLALWFCIVVVLGGGGSVTSFSSSSSSSFQSELSRMTYDAIEMSKDPTKFDQALSVFRKITLKGTTIYSYVFKHTFSSTRTYIHTHTTAPNSPTSWYNLGSHLLRGGAGLDVAEKSFRRAIELSSSRRDRSPLFLSLGATLEARDQPREAARVYRDALMECSSSRHEADLWSNLGSALYTMNRLDEARDMLRQALKIEPNHKTAKSNLESINGKQKRQEQKHCNAEMQWSGANQFHDRCGHDSNHISTPSSFTSSQSPRPLRSRKMTSLTERQVIKAVMYVFDDPNSQKWIGFDDEKRYTFFDGTDMESARALLSSKIEILPDKVDAFFNDCKSRNHHSTTTSSFIIVGEGKDALDVVSSSTGSHRIYCNIGGEVGRGVVIRGRDVDVKEYLALHDEEIIREHLGNASIYVHHTLSHLLDDSDILPISIYVKSGSRSYGVDLAGQAFMQNIREVWQALDPDRAEWEIERMQFGHIRDSNLTYVTFYVSIESDNEISSENMNLHDTVQNLVALDAAGKLTKFTPLERLALAQDLTISTNAQSYEALSQHVSSLSTLFTSELDTLSRLRGHEGNMLYDIVEELREIESRPSFIVMRMNNIDQIRKALGFEDVFGIPSVSRHKNDGDYIYETPYSIANFAYGVCFFQGFKSLFTFARPAMSAWKRLLRNDNEIALVIGSNVGSEAFYFALWLRVPTIGVEILCSLNDVANKMREDKNIPTHALRFICEDALRVSPIETFQRAGIVWLDDQTFDVDLIASLALRIYQHVPVESTIITYRSEVLLNIVHEKNGKPCFEKIGMPSHIATSWSTSPKDGMVPLFFLRKKAYIDKSDDIGKCMISPSLV